MKSAEIRQSFLEFFRSKGHEIVPSAPLLPGSPNLLFTNAGMNQFVPYFLGEREAPYARAADTQKCIRAGGKHNDLDDVGLDTYHQTFFEMLGNWSFGDYFKKEAIEWAWELLTKVWKFPRERLYVTVYKPAPGDPAAFDQEAYDFWAALLKADGLDPAKHILTGGKKDNFWMMGDTGPCGPCSEIHIDLTEKGDTNGRLVNADSPYCIEIWNLVFIQFNAEQDGGFTPLRARHVDTGMGFERVAGILATTRGFTDFSRPPSNYNCDLFESIFARITELCGKQYTATLPADPKRLTPAEFNDVAFRVLADHIRTLCCSIADGILPGNEGRNYVLRRILRRAIMFGRRLGLSDGFFTKLADPVIENLGPVFPELIQQQSVIRRVIASEESAFDRTIDRGIQMIEKLLADRPEQISGEDAFVLYDTYGFPVDLTEILANERGVKVDKVGFERAMEAQKERARAARKTTVIKVNEGDADAAATRFVGYDAIAEGAHESTLSAVETADGQVFAVFVSTPFYAEMGGQIGDCGTVEIAGRSFAVTRTIKDGAGRFLHALETAAGDIEWLREQAAAGAPARLKVERERRLAIQRHHTATHLIHWALRDVLGTHVRQAGSYVGPDRLRFDFSHFEAISAEQLRTIERRVNERIIANAPVRWYEVPFDEKPEGCIAFFGEKYGSIVRVVDVGGYSLELCGGTHVNATGELGLVRIVAESGISAGTRRIEALAGTPAAALAEEHTALLNQLAATFSVSAAELPRRVSDLQERLAAAEREIRHLRASINELKAGDLAASGVEWQGLKILATRLDAADPNELRNSAAQLFKQMQLDAAVIGATFGDKVTLIALASPAANAKGLRAGDTIRNLTAKLGGKGGGKPDFAMGGGSNPDQLDDVLAGWTKEPLA